ncbi:MAG: HDOD domain-containing protein [Dactylosporangium sp.]|nr:HDOD domain-containing protein [Dactylosporangium sp.]
MTFATHPSTALEMLATDPADVVVSDMRMPDMDGAGLLQEVRTRWPDTVRIILSGYADEGAALRSVPVAHQFLAKPCDPATLMATIRDACELQDRLSRPELRRLVGGLGALPSAPQSFAAITEALAQPEVHLRQVASIIEQDPSCAAKLLQIVNSSFFGLARQVTRVDEAVAYLGVTRVRDVVLAAEVADMFHCSTPELAGIAQEVNERSGIVAAKARELVKPRHAHDAFMAGILHDIGRLALATVLPDQYGAIAREQCTGDDLVLLEQELLGASHADVGAYLLRLWGLPFTLVDAVARHHDQISSDDDSPLAIAVATAVSQLDGAADTATLTPEVHSG